MRRFSFAHDNGANVLTLMSYFKFDFASGSLGAEVESLSDEALEMVDAARAENDGRPSPPNAARAAASMPLDAPVMTCLH